jgi:hypothetical protein
MRNFGPLRFALADVGFVAGRLAWQVRRIAQRRPDDTPECLLRDLLRHSVFVRGPQT